MQYHVLLLERDSCNSYIDAGLCVVPPLAARALDPTSVWQHWHPTNAVYVLGLHLLTIQLILWPVSVCCTETMTSAYLSNLPLYTWCHYLHCSIIPLSNSIAHGMMVKYEAFDDR